MSSLHCPCCLARDGTRLHQPQGHLLPNPHFPWKFHTHALSRHEPIKILWESSLELYGHKLLLTRTEQTRKKSSLVFHAKTLNQHNRNHKPGMRVAQGHAKMFLLLFSLFFPFWVSIISPKLWWWSSNIFLIKLESWRENPSHKFLRWKQLHG